MVFLRLFLTPGPLSTRFPVPGIILPCSSLANSCSFFTFQFTSQFSWKTFPDTFPNLNLVPLYVLLHTASILVLYYHSLKFVIIYLVTYSYFFFSNNSIHLFLAVLGLRCFTSFSVFVESRGYSLVVVWRLLIVVASLVVKHRV